MSEILYESMHSSRFQVLELENSRLHEQLEQLRIQYSILRDLQQKGLTRNAPPTVEVTPSEPSKDSTLQDVHQQKGLTHDAPPTVEVTPSEPSEAEQEGAEQTGNTWCEKLTYHPKIQYFVN